MRLRVVALVAVIFGPLATAAQAATLTHVIVLVRDMQAARRAFAEAGFKIQPTSPISQGLIHAVIPFRDGTFLELIAARGHSREAAAVLSYVRFGDVAAAAGFEVPDVYAERRALKSRGFRIDPPEVSPHWIDLDFSEPAGILEPFFLYQYRDDYAQRDRRKYANLAAAQPYGAIGLRGIDVAVEPGLHAAAVYAAARLRGVTAVERGAGDPRIVLVHISSSLSQRKGTTIIVDRCRIRYD